MSKRLSEMTSQQIEAKRLRDRMRHAEKSPAQKEAWKEACRERYQEKYRSIRKAERQAATPGDRQARREYERERHQRMDLEKKKERSARYAAYKRERQGKYREIARLRRESLTLEQKQEIRDRDRKWRKKNLDTVNAKTHRRRAKLRGSVGSYTPKEWLELKERCDHRCLKCGLQEPEIKLTVDHIVPISKGGSNWIVNIQPLCKSCNSSKNVQSVNYLERAAA